MGKYVSVCIGGAITLIGFIGLRHWHGQFLTVAKGLLPAFLVFAGVIAIIAGISELKDEAASKK